MSAPDPESLGFDAFLGTWCAPTEQEPPTRIRTMRTRSLRSGGLPDAVRGLVPLRYFLGPKNPAAARAAERIQQAGRRSGNRPENPPKTKKWRELHVPAGRTPYVLRYRIDEDTAVMARAWHRGDR